MECEKASSTAAFSRKLRNGHGQSFSFSGSAIYDGVFSSPSKKKSSAVDYGEIFRGSGASIPFLEVPELNEKKIKVDVRRSKLDYSTVFGGFETLDFAVSHEELIVKPKKRSASSSQSREWESKKSEPNSNVASPGPKKVESSPAKNKVSSPEALHQSTRAKQLNMSNHQTNVNGGNGTAHIAQFGAVTDHTRMVDGPCPLQNKVSSPEALHLSTGAELLNMPYHQTNVNGGNGAGHTAQFGAVSDDTRTIDGPCPLQKAESNSSSVLSANHKPSIETLVEENGNKSGSESSDVHHSVASSRRSSKTDSEFQNIACQSGYSVRDKLFQDGLETSDNNDQSKMTPPSVSQKTLSNSEAGSERSLGKNLGVSRSSLSEDTDVPGSPPYFDEEADVNSSAVASAAAAKKAIEEAQLSIKIAKEIMERKTAGFYSSRKQKFYDDGKVMEKRKIGKDGGSFREKERKDLCEEGHISRQTSSAEAEEHARKARKLWEVPRVFSKSAVDHKQQEAEKCETMQLVDERARRPRKLWEIPGGFLKATLGHKVEEAENHEGAEYGNNTRAEAQSGDESKREGKAIAGNTFFTLEQLGNKIKSVAVAFAGNKDQKDDAVGGRRCSTTECSNISKLPDEVLNQEIEKETSNASSSEQNQEKFFVAPQLETCETKLTDVHEPTKTVRKTDEDKHIEHIDKLLQDPLQKQEKETEPLEQDIIVCESEDVPNRTETETRFDETSGQKEFSTTSEEVYEIVKFREKYAKACELGEDKEELRGSYSEENVNDRSDEAQDFKRVDIMLNDTSNGEETDNIAQQVGDTGLHENWNMLKQMFRQMFQTVDSKRDEDICHLAESGPMYLEVDQIAEAENNIGANNDESDTANQQDEIETVSLESEEPCIDDKVIENLKLSLYSDERDQAAGETRACSVDKLAKEGVATIEACNEEEVMQFEAGGSAQRVFTLHATKDQARLPTDILGIDQSEMDSSDSDMKSEQIPCDQNSESGHMVRENENDGEELSFESELGDGGVEIADFEPTYPEETSTASSMGEQVEELSSESQENGGDVEIERIHKQVEDVNAHKQVEDVNAHKQVEDVNAHKQMEDMNAFMLSSEDILSGYRKEAETDQSPCKSDECEEPSEESDKSETCQSTEDNLDNEDFIKEEENFKPSPMGGELHSRKNSEGSESGSLSEAGVELEEAVSETRTETSGEKQNDSMKKEGVIKVPSQKEAKTQDEHLKKIDEAKERQKEKEKERIMVERAIREARERAFAEARERAEKAALEKVTKEARRRATAEARGRSEKSSVEANEKQSSVDKASMEARLRAERAAVERALAEARERALERALSEKARNQGDKSFGQSKGSDNSKSSGQSSAPNHNANGEPAQRCKARSERNQRTMESAAKALAEKKMRDLIAQKEEAERNRLAETLDAEVKRWSSGKEGNLRALLSTLHYILGPESGWKPTPLTDLVATAAVRKAYRRATLYVHPDKLQQRGAGTQQKYTCEKVFDLLKEAWNKFSADER